MNIIQPDEWHISIRKENGIWYEEYIEYIQDTEENREVMIKTINIINKSGLLYGDTIKIEKDGMIGMKTTIETSDFKIIANQLTGEFMYFSDFGNVTIKDLFRYTIAMGLKNHIGGGLDGG